MNAASVFGGGAVRKDLPILLRVVLGITVVLVAFSRIYLGVHTPQDILVGTVAGTLVMWLTDRPNAVRPVVREETCEQKKEGRCKQKKECGGIDTVSAIAYNARIDTVSVDSCT